MNKKLNWIDALKAFAILGILLNHLVEEFGPGPWFTNPSSNWPVLSERLSNIFPHGQSFAVNLVTFLGWLGDSGPGVFILLSGLGLTLSAMKLNSSGIKAAEFYKKRLFRLYPLFIAIQLFVIGGSFLFSRAYSVSDPRVILSLLGLRFTDSTFFFINPSWWFIWLILQMYLIFPFLYLLLKKIGNVKFLIITFAFTFISRAAGLFDFPFIGRLYYWMTGIFFGTRLAEFTAGMVLGAIIFQKQKDISELVSFKKILGFSVLIYLAGFAASLTWAGSIISNLLVTVGLSGLFYSVWEGIIKNKIPVAVKPILWVGITSYSVYLVHQPLIQWTAAIPNHTLQIIVSLFLVILSFPLGLLIEKIVKFIMDIIQNKREINYPALISAILIFFVLASILLFDQRLGTTKKYAAYEYMLFISGILLSVIYFSKRKASGRGLLLDSTAVYIIGLTLFMFPKQNGINALAVGIFFFIPGLLYFKYIGNDLTAFILSVFTSLTVMISAEVILRNYSPMEAGKWGEYPALQTHPTRTYSLKPAKTTRLHYNNYNYLLKTNSLGLACPESVVNENGDNVFKILVIGDAFTMPEGVEYGNSYTALLQKKFHKISYKKQINVINAGVTGYGPVEELPELRELGTYFKPDIIVYQFFINEFYEVDITRDHRLKNIGLEKTYTNLNEEIFFNSQFSVHLKRLEDDLLETLTGRSASWRYYKALLQFYKTKNNTYYSSERLKKIHYYLNSMKQFADSIHSEFYILFVPGAVAVTSPKFMNYFPFDINIKDKSRFDFTLPQKNLFKITNELGIKVIDLTDDLKASKKQPLYYPDSWHWNKEGHKIVAQRLFDVLSPDIKNLKFRETSFSRVSSSK